jgi:PAS domain S-box-containing protein
MKAADSKHRWRLAATGVLLSVLLAAAFTLGSLNVPFKPDSWRDILPLVALSSFITAALLVFLLILVRSVLRLWIERSREQLGARFKTKMVVGAMAISLLPVVFMFVVSYSLLNRTLMTWFPRPLEIASDETQKLFQELGRAQLSRLHMLARQAAANVQRTDEQFLEHSFLLGADAVWILDADGRPLRGGVICENAPVDRSLPLCVEPGVFGKLLQVLPSGVEVWEAKEQQYFGARVPLPRSSAGGFLVSGYRAMPDFFNRLTRIQAQTRDYQRARQDLGPLKRQFELILLFFTVLLLFSVTWIALFLAKQVTVPIQALAEGTREVSAGNFDYQVPEQTHDELGVLVRSFNNMTTQLRDSRSQIDEFTRSLQQAVQELERRRQLIETILENIPAAVLSLDATGTILRGNAVLSRIFGPAAREARALHELLGADAGRTVQLLMRRSLRMGVISREIETVVAGHVLHLAVTVSSLGPHRANTGYVVVLDDLTEMLRAQKSAAWQEVARRIAHEIKNPLTPIQLSAQRLARFVERRESSKNAAPSDPELARLVQECSRLIEREVSSLAALVNEFSQFVRFPTAKLGPASANTIVRQALEVFSGRLDGITLKASLAENLPQVRADDGLLRSVLVNLIDNAAEALEGAPYREITVSTRSSGEGERVEISVADTGQGISPEDKDKLFLPQFSTKERGTGLGLAIAARIVAEHGGTIHVEDNSPVGSRFVIELPAAEVAAISTPERNGVEAI